MPNDVGNQVVAVDFDSTLAYRDDDQPLDVLGEPIWAMVKLVKYWMAMGHPVEIFTARVYQRPDQISAIQDWLEDVATLPRLEVGCQKKPNFWKIYDDLAIPVVKNMGQTLQCAQTAAGQLATQPSAWLANHKPRSR